MDLLEEAEAERKPVSHAGESVVHRTDVVEAFTRICDGDTGRLVVLEEQQIGERRLRPFDLRREHSLFPDVGVEKLIGDRKKKRDPVEPPEGLIRLASNSWVSGSISRGGLGGSGFGWKT